MRLTFSSTGVLGVVQLSLRDHTDHHPDLSVSPSEIRLQKVKKIKAHPAVSWRSYAVGSEEMMLAAPTAWQMECEVKVKVAVSHSLEM